MKVPLLNILIILIIFFFNITSGQQAIVGYISEQNLGTLG